MLLVWVYLVAVISALPINVEVREDYGQIGDELAVTEPDYNTLAYEEDDEEVTEGYEDLDGIEELDDDGLEGSGEEDQKEESHLEPGMENEYVLVGDVLVKKSKLDMYNKLFDGTQTRAKRQAAANYFKWPNNTLYYWIDASISASKKASIAAAMKYISSRTCINFVQSKTNTDRIKFFSGNGCYSAIGRDEGEQPLSLGNGCEVVGTVAHEIMHAIGIFHMQSRHDRDKFVTVNLTYVPEDMKHNFRKLAADDTIDSAPYELGSVMHYGAKDFAKPKDKFSIQSKDKRYMYTMGSQIISFFDIKRINDFYQCKPACPSSTLAKCKNGGLPNPRQCTRCNCPLGYAGPLCGMRPTGCGKSLSAQPQWKTAVMKLGAAGLRNDFSYCTNWINAPKGTQIRLKVTKVVNGQCNYSCRFNGIEMKTNPNARVVNPRVCCPNTMTAVQYSSLNPTPIVAFNRRGISEFTFQYRYVKTPASG